MPLPFAIHVDEDLIVQALPSGFSVHTRKVKIFIDGGTHKIHFQPHESCFKSLDDEFDWLQSAYRRK